MKAPMKLLIFVFLGIITFPVALFLTFSLPYIPFWNNFLSTYGGPWDTMGVKLSILYNSLLGTLFGFFVYKKVYACVFPVVCFLTSLVSNLLILKFVPNALELYNSRIPWILFIPIGVGLGLSIRLYQLIVAKEQKRRLQIFLVVSMILLAGSFINRYSILSAFVGSDSTQLHYAVSVNNIRAVKILLENGADVNAKDYVGTTPLHNAATFNDQNLEIVKILLEYGAELDVIDQYGSTPLFRAASSNNFDTVEILLENGADANGKGTNGNPPLSVAVSNNDIDTSKLLIEYGADVNTTNVFGEKPLHQAAFRNNIDIANILIENGADVNAKDQDGATPLHHAAFNNSLEIVKILLDNGADVSLENKDGNTPQQIAVSNNNIEIAELLIQKGAIDN